MNLLNLITLPTTEGDEVPVVHTLSDISTSWSEKAHVGSRFELIDVEQCEYINYLTIFEPEDLMYAGYHKRDSLNDGNGWYSGSVGKNNHLWTLRKEHPAEDFMLLIYAGHDNKDDAMTLEDATIEHLWETVGKYKDGGKCLNLVRNVNGFYFDPTGIERSEETRAKMSKAKSGEKNPLYGRFGADHIRSKPVIELVSGSVYPGAHEASRQTGIKQTSITNNCANSRNKLLNDKPLTGSLHRNMNGKPNPNFGKCWMKYSDFLAEINAGRSVEVHSKN